MTLPALIKCLNESQALIHLRQINLLNKKFLDLQARDPQKSGNEMPESLSRLDSW